MSQMSVISPDIQKAVNVLHNGGLVALPTETVYGLGADARNPEAVKKIFAAKGRPADHPLIVHLANATQLKEWARNIPEAAWKLAEAFWPGPLTLILPRLPDVPDTVTGGLETVALRVPDHPIALELLKAFGGGIAAPSANRYGQVSPTSAEDVKEELNENVDLILDGGRCAVGIESTIVDLSSPTLRVLRPGKITEEELQRVVGNMDETASDNGPIRYPGGKSSHYAPRARVVLASWNDAQQHVDQWLSQGVRVGLLSSHLPAALSDIVIWLPLTESAEGQAHELYRSLREADHLGLDVLVAVMPEDVGIGHAVRDRLYRAAGLGDSGDV